MENALQAALRSAKLAPNPEPNLAQATAHAERPVAAEKDQTYRFRNLPCSIQPDEQLWCISGINLKGGSGVLEWCYDEADAQFMLEKMQAFKQFENLSAAPFLTVFPTHH